MACDGAGEREVLDRHRQPLHDARRFLAVPFIETDGGSAGRESLPLQRVDVTGLQHLPRRAAVRYREEIVAFVRRLRSSYQQAAVPDFPVDCCPVDGCEENRPDRVARREYRFDPVTAPIVLFTGLELCKGQP